MLVDDKHPVAHSLLVSAGMQLILLGGGLVAVTSLLASMLQIGWQGFAATVGCYALFGALVVAGLAYHAPHRQFGLANSVTLARASLAALLWGVIAEMVLGTINTIDAQGRWILVLLATAALLSDGIDGWAARRNHTESDFGARFDMETDSLFLLALSLLAYAVGEVGAWVLVSGLLRYAFLLAGWLWPPLAAPLLPLWRRKAICVAQMIVLIVSLAPIVPAPAAQTLCVVGLALLMYSFSWDFIWLTAKSSRMR